MNVRIFVAVATVAILLLVLAHAQQSHWASPDDKTAKYMIDMERKWAEGVCADNGVVASLLADDFRARQPKVRASLKPMNSRTRRPRVPLMIAESMRRKCISSGTESALSTAANMLLAKIKKQPSTKVCQVWTDTWMKRDGTWQIIASQDNRVACK